MNCNYGVLDRIGNHFAIDDNLLDYVFAYFKARYAHPTKGMNTAFEKLNWRTGESRKKADVASAFRFATPNKDTKFRACLYIIYRMRNNLFHGEKWAYDLRGQEQNFRLALNILDSIVSWAELPRES